MKTTRLLRLFVTAISSATLSTVGCAQKENPAASAEVAPAKWSDLQDLSYDARPQFFAGLKQLEHAVDRQIAELSARRAAMKSTRDTKAWDFAMKEMGNARSYLKGMGAEAAKATVETWPQQKEKVGQAWMRTQAAYDSVKTSTTG
jgi:hypothetical protein